MVTPRRRRLSSERREELILAAIELATDQGLDRLTARDVADKVGVTSSLIHHYFPSIDSLVIEVFERVATEDLQRLHEGLDQLDPADALKLFQERSIDASRDTALTVWLSAWLAASRRAGLREAATTLMGSGVEALAVILQKGTELGDFSCADPDASALRILTVADGFLIHRALKFGEFRRLDLAGFMRETIEREIQASLG